MKPETQQDDDRILLYLRQSVLKQVLVSGEILIII